MTQQFTKGKRKNDAFFNQGAQCITLMISTFSLTLSACENESTPTQRDQSDQAVAGTNVSNELDQTVADTGPESSGEPAGEETAGEALGGEALGGESASGETAGTEEGGMSTPLAGEEERMPSCLISCAEFVECALKQCSGYDQSDDALLMEECLGLCNPNIARLFDQLTGCPEKIRFASTVRTDFLDFCDSVTAGFCETYIATCGEWIGTSDCDMQYNDAPRNGSEYTSGAHQQCYEYHLGTAQRALEEGDDARVREGCERAAGLNTCVDE